MTNWPGTSLLNATSLLSVQAGSGGQIYPYGSSNAGAVWPAANRAIYIPVLVEAPVTVLKMVVWPTVQNGNLDVGIYDEKFNRLVSIGSTAVGVAAAPQVLDITDTPLDPGCYFLAMNCDNTTAAFNRATSSIAGYLQMCGVQQQAVGAVALPNPATPANPASTYVPLLQAVFMQATV